MAFSVRDLITGSLRLLGIKGQGEVASGAEAVDALSVLNELMDALNSSGVICYTTQMTVFPFSSLQQSYTFGPTGQIVVPTRPSKLVGAWIRDNGTSPANDTPLAIIADTEYGDIVAKTTSGTIPMGIYLDRQYPNANLYLWPVPSDSSKSLVLQYMAPLNSALTLDSDASFPPAFRQMLRFNLACLIAPEYGIEAPVTVQQTAMTSRQLIEQANFQIYTMDFDVASQGAYLINSDASVYRV